MDDTKHYSDLPPLTIDQVRELAATIREIFGGNVPRTGFADRLLMFLEDVPGYESAKLLRRWLSRRGPSTPAIATSPDLYLRRLLLAGCLALSMSVNC